MMTGYGSRDKIAMARDKGVSEFLMKPFSAKDLSKRILSIIKSPRDFVITENFQGPCRRRRVDTSFTGSNIRGTVNVPKKIIKANNMLQTKVGLGVIDENTLIRAQSLLDNNKINFVPIAETFLGQLRSALNTAHKSENGGHRVIESLTDPVMQIKANARIFKYDLLGDLASVMMNFLDNLNVLDHDALDIVEAHHATLTHIIHAEMKGNGGEVGKSIQNELEGACKRYMNSRAEELRNRLRHALKEGASA